MESVQITPSPKKKNKDPDDFSHIPSKVSPMPKHPRQKFKSNGFKGFYSKIGCHYFSDPRTRELARQFYKDLTKLAENKEHDGAGYEINVAFSF